MKGIPYQKQKKAHTTVIYRNYNNVTFISVTYSNLEWLNKSFIREKTLKKTIKILQVMKFTIMFSNKFFNDIHNKHKVS